MMFHLKLRENQHARMWRDILCVNRAKGKKGASWATPFTGASLFSERKGGGREREAASPAFARLKGDRRIVGLRVSKIGRALRGERSKCKAGARG